MRNKKGTSRPRAQGKRDKRVNHCCRTSGYQILTKGCKVLMGDGWACCG